MIRMDDQQGSATWHQAPPADDLVQDRPDPFYLDPGWLLRVADGGEVVASGDAQEVAQRWHEAKKDGRVYEVVDPEGRVVEKPDRTADIAKLAKRWRVEIHRGAVRQLHYEGVYAIAADEYAKACRQYRSGTVVFLTPLGEVYKQRARTQWRHVLDIDKLVTDESAADRYEGTLSRNAPDRPRPELVGPDQAEPDSVGHSATDRPTRAMRPAVDAPAAAAGISRISRLHALGAALAQAELTLSVVRRKLTAEVEQTDTDASEAARALLEMLAGLDP